MTQPDSGVGVFLAKKCSADYITLNRGPLGGAAPLGLSSMDNPCMPILSIMVIVLHSLSRYEHSNERS